MARGGGCSKPVRNCNCCSVTRCRETLRQIFHQADLDGYGLLSKREFSLYNLRASGEEAGDDIWEVVQGVTSHARFTVFKIVL